MQERKRKIQTSVITIAFIIGALILSTQNTEKTLVLLVLAFLWAFLVYKLNNLQKASFLLFLLIIPLNITLQLPQQLSFWGFDLTLSDPYVEGVKANYLIPTISILDVGMALIILSSFIESGLKAINKRDWKLVSIISGYSMIHIMYFQSFLVGFNMTRIVLYILAGFCIKTFIKTQVSEKISDNNKLRRTKFIKYSLIIIFLCLLTQGIIGMIQFYSGSSLGISFLGESILQKGVMGVSFTELAGSLYLRAYGSFPHPNIFAGYLLLIFMFGYWLYLNKSYFKSFKSNLFSIKTYSLITMLISSFFVIFTMSRVTILLFLFSWCLFLLSQSKIKFPLKPKTMNMTIIPALLVERFASLFSSGGFSFKDRMELVKVSIEIIKNNLWFGVGHGQFVAAMEGMVVTTKGGFSLLQPVHNVFLLFIAEHGVIVGGIVLVLLVWWFVNRVMKKQFSTFSLLCIFCFLVIGSFDHYFLTLPQGLVICGWIYSLSNARHVIE